MQLIAAYRQERIEPTRNSGVTSLFSLKQQAIVAEVRGSVTFMDAKTGRPTDIRKLGGSWPDFFSLAAMPTLRPARLTTAYATLLPSICAVSDSVSP